MPQVISRHSLRRLTEEKDNKLPLNFEKIEVVKKENTSNLTAVLKDADNNTNPTQKNQ